MHHYSLLQIREMADALSAVAQVLETNPFYLRSKQIRQVDKALHFIESLTPQALINEAKLWKQSHEAAIVLKKKLTAIDETQIKIESMEREIEDLQQQTRAWYGLDSEIRTIIIEHANRAEEFLRNDGERTEADVIKRYNRSLELKKLLPYADQAPYLCDSIYHFTEKARYNHNLEKLKLRIDSVHTRMKTIRNGFYVALALCVLIATLPICLPFSITLWSRKQKLKSHLIVYEDLQTREHKRLVLAEQGDKIIQEIQSIMGKISYETIKELLMEVKELKTEFHDSDRFLSVCAMILSFIDTHQEILVELFGSVPKSPHDRFLWLAQNVKKYETEYKKLESLQSDKHDLCLQKKQAAKGYEREILIQGIAQLSDSMKSIMHIPLDNNHKSAFIEIYLQTPEIIKKIRETIYFANQNYEVNLEDWNSAKSCCKKYAYDLALFVLDSEIEDLQKDLDKSVDKLSGTPNTQTIKEEVIV